MKIITKKLIHLALFFLLVASQSSGVAARDSTLSCGSIPFLDPGVTISSIEGLDQIIQLNSATHNVSIIFSTTKVRSEYFLKVAYDGTTVVQTPRVSPEQSGSNYKITFVLSTATDLAILNSFNDDTLARTFDVTLFANRGWALGDELCEIGNYTVATPELLSEIDVNQPGKYCGVYDPRTFECVTTDGTKVQSADHDMCDGSQNNNSQYECCSVKYLSLTNNVCPSEQIVGCGTMVDSACRTSDGRYINNYSSCNSRASVCCSSLNLCPAADKPAPEPITGCGIWVGNACKTDDGKYVRDPRGCMADSAKCCSSGAQPDSCTGQNSTPEPTCGRLVEDKNPDNNVCVFGTNPVTRGFVSCPKAGECCRETSQCTPVDDDPDGGVDPGNDQIDPPIQGPTLETFNALNPLITEGSAQAKRLSTPGGIVTRFLQFAFPIAGLILFAMLSWAGFEILAGASNQKSLDAGKQRATAAFVGFLLLFASYWLMQIVEVIFGISIL
ncbi:MAG: hypothetical protein O2840_04850 [bacterium]|nr:hypothetical protein [bacterium]